MRFRLTVEDIARICHEANRALCLALGDTSHLPWDQAPEWQRKSSIEGVEKVLLDPDISAEEIQLAWADSKRRDGWVYGPVKDADKKTHPCLVPFADLPAEQRAKDHLFINTVWGVVDLWPVELKPL